MATQKRKTISRLTRSLLAEGESGHADFKRLPDSISADDLVPSRVVLEFDVTQPPAG
jgi:hypothetical protein